MSRGELAEEQAVRADRQRRIVATGLQKNLTSVGCGARRSEIHAIAEYHILHFCRWEKPAAPVGLHRHGFLTAIEMVATMDIGALRLLRNRRAQCGDVGDIQPIAREKWLEP